MAKYHLLDKLIVKPGSKVSLKRDFDPGFKLAQIDKTEAAELLSRGVEKLSEYQDKLYAQNSYSLLVIFQAMDAAGKDGTIKHVMSGVNPQGCQVYSFKVPSHEEIDHDYMWRYMKSLPERGRIGIFNRSYYEEVLVARVHRAVLDRQQLPSHSVDKGIWKRRFEEINNFESYLTKQGVQVLKFYLNISKDEQKKRFLDRIEKPEKNWKFSAADVYERKFWNDYMHAYEECLSHTSTKAAPWYVIPADNKPFTRLCVAHVIAEHLKGLNLRYPRVSAEQKRALQEARLLLEQER